VDEGGAAQRGYVPFVGAMHRKSAFALFQTGIL